MSSKSAKQHHMMEAAAQNAAFAIVDADKTRRTYIVSHLLELYHRRGASHWELPAPNHTNP